MAKEKKPLQQKYSGEWVTLYYFSFLHPKVRDA